MRRLLACAIATTILVGCTTDGSDDHPQSNWRRYDYNHPDPSYGGYDASRYYRESPAQRERRLSERDRIYRGRDGRYYCRRSDGTTGLVVGAIAGGMLGDRIAPGGSETLGTVLGALAGALAGQAIDRSDVRCR